jgi:hypothetical protein
MYKLIEPPSGSSLPQHLMKDDQCIAWVHDHKEGHVLVDRLGRDFRDEDLEVAQTLVDANYAGERAHRLVWAIDGIPLEHLEIMCRHYRAMIPSKELELVPVEIAVRAMTAAAQ